MNIRIGNGYDIHCLVPERPLILGGVDIPHELGLLGHSDAERLTHAIMDAMLGFELRRYRAVFPADNGQWVRYGIVLEQVSRLVARLADQVIVVSESLAKSMPKRSYHVIPSGLDLQMFCPGSKIEARQRLGLDASKYYVLFVGSTNRPTKRFDLAKEAVERLQSDLNVELLVATNVRHEQVPDFLNASDALLLTSVHEGSPNVVKEALACNLPVVSTDVGDVRQRIGNIPGCAILPDARPETITAALRQVLQRGKRVNSRNMVLDLDETILTQKVIGVYKQTLSVRN